MAASKGIPFWLIALGGGLVYFTRLATTATSLEYDIVGLRLKGANLATTELEGDLKIVNPSNQKLVMSDILLIAKYKGSVIGQVRSSRRIELAKRDTTIVQFPLVLQNVAVINNLLSLFSSGKFAGIALSGSLVVNGVRYPIDETIGIS